MLPRFGWYPAGWAFLFFCSSRGDGKGRKQIQKERERKEATVVQFLSNNTLSLNPGKKTSRNGGTSKHSFFFVGLPLFLSHRIESETVS
jgi:hypothetical protein